MPKKTYIARINLVYVFFTIIFCFVLIANTIFRGWLTGAKAQPEKQNSTAIQPPEPMGCRFGLCDIRRNAFSVILSPDHKFAAVSDTVGRVLLIDTARGATIRMFKGYREAQCAFIQVPDEKKSKHKGHTRIALFLLIYSGKKGTLEVFALQKGRKIVTFTAAKHSRLFYIDYSLMGFTATTKSRYICPFTCILMDNDGSLKEIIVPFHFSLSEKNSSRIRDLHLFKRLKQTIKSGEIESLMIEAVTTCKELQTHEMKLQCLEMLILCKEIEVEVILACVQHFLDDNNTLEINDNDLKKLLVMCKNLQKLLLFYQFITNVDLDEKNGNNEDEKQEDLFTMAGEQTKNLQKLLDLNTVLDNQRSGELKVSFKDENDSSISKFLAVFNLNVETSISLKNDVDESLLYNVATVIFKRYITSSPINPDVLKSGVIRSGIITEDLFKLLLMYWVNRPLRLDMNLENEMRNLSCVVFALALTANPEEVAVEYNSTSVFWCKIREMLEDSLRPFPALTAAIVCQSIGQRIEHERDMQVRLFCTTHKW